MKRTIYTVLATVALVGCNQTPETPTPADTVAVINELGAQSDANEIIALGAQGDYVLKLHETDVLREIASKAKTVQFLSANIQNKSDDGVCLLNIIPTKTMDVVNAGSTCNYRLVCGEISDMNAMYAVELCEE